MNERIKQLAEQAGFYVAGNKIYIPTTSEDITTCQTKFAELLVQEFAATAGYYYARNECMSPTQIKNHFGVEL